MTQENFQPLHDRYCSLTGRDLTLTMAVHFQWQVWVSKGYTASDLALVVAHIKKLIAKDRRRPESLRFHNLIGDTERFNEDLAEARALARVTPPTARDRVLAQTGRPAPERNTAKSAAQIMADMALMKRLSQEAGI